MKVNEFTSSLCFNSKEEAQTKIDNAALKTNSIAISASLQLHPTIQPEPIQKTWSEVEVELDRGHLKMQECLTRLRLLKSKSISQSSLIASFASGVITATIAKMLAISSLASFVIGMLTALLIATSSIYYFGATIRNIQ